MAKYDKLKLEFKLLGMGYLYWDVSVFVDEYSQNMKTLEENIADFEEWILSN